MKSVKIKIKEDNLVRKERMLTRNDLSLNFIKGIDIPSWRINWFVLKDGEANTKKLLFTFEVSVYEDFEEIVKELYELKKQDTVINFNIQCGVHEVPETLFIKEFNQDWKIQKAYFTIVGERFNNESLVIKVILTTNDDIPEIYFTSPNEKLL